jgi:hypothetical protein
MKKMPHGSYLMRLVFPLKSFLDLLQLQLTSGYIGKLFLQRLVRLDVGLKLGARLCIFLSCLRIPLDLLLLESRVFLPLLGQRLPDLI